ncbi:7-carboxy-7-deazaguanine synthase QueE [Listeria booriae]|uniref:7-carboxy-7-deazaguanine synthase QueE n=1 Tax=Listeria booriae TaxID=1552123 RepID=UPI0016294B89|nr:7-carboxy-7-deazaguanine synthase QueE [Listeria booriae]MBC1889021.1 7-carboxy-7-deazaguanine synthase QueE [Listeria booriae]MBC2106505.1 7-carboxy-7-deazaguanine synthase QueE [Listeria booriae]
MMHREYRIVEIFETMQGEGYNTGMPSVFIRFGRCNLDCPWCDTNYNEFVMMTGEQILAEVHKYEARNIVITGGEPTIQRGIEELLQVLKAEGYYLAIETNGLKDVPVEIDYVATSPKRLYSNMYEKRHLSQADEVRIVVDGDVQAFCAQIEALIPAKRYYLSPCEVDGDFNMLETIRQLGQLNVTRGENKWALSIQTHKLAGIE